MIIREAIDFKRGQGVKASLGVGMIYQIEEWLSKLNDEGDIGEWTINEDHSISVIGRVDLRGNIDGNLPEYINFNKTFIYCKRQVLYGELNESKNIRWRKINRWNKDSTDP